MLSQDAPRRGILRSVPRWAESLWGWVGPLCLLVMFASVLLGRDRLAFRDVSYFYTPLYEMVDQQCRAQRWGALGSALWNPLDQTGMPLAGETTTAVFYPLRMLVYAPAWSAETAMGVYAVLHLFIASIGATSVARRYGCDRCSAAVAGVIYPLSGIMLFLVTNPPFLVAAAWLPFVLTPLMSRQDRWILIPAIAMAMMILGGDPPTALHALIVATGVRLVGFLSTLPVIHQRGFAVAWRTLQMKIRSQPWQVVRRHFGWQWISIVLLASILAAPQIAASVAWSARSDRVLSHKAPEIDQTRQQAYAFSIAPWRLAEIAIPNLYGSPWPVNTRWDRIVFDHGVLRAETAVWTPTLYCGTVLPCFAGYSWFVSRFRNRQQLSQRGRSRRRWRIGIRRRQTWQWLVVLGMGLAASMGAYGPAYLIRSAALAINSLFAQIGVAWTLPSAWSGVDGKVGGLYWLLHEFLPGYDSLRYPSKWLPFAAFAIAVLSAIAVHYCGRTQRERERSRRTASHFEPGEPSPGWAILLVAVVIGIVSVLLAGAVGQAASGLSDPFWGPFEQTQAARQVWVSGLHLFVVIAVSLWIYFRSRGFACRPLISSKCHDVRPWWLALVVLDLMIAHWSLAPRIDRVREREVLGQVAEEITAPRRWMRLHRDGGFATEWSESFQADRMLFVEAGLRHAWFGRWHLEHDHAMFNGIVSIGSREMAEFWHYARKLDRELQATRDSTADRRWRGWCAMLGVEGYLRSGGSGNRVLCGNSTGVLPPVTWERLDGPRKVSDSLIGSLSSPRLHTSVTTQTSDRAAAWHDLLERHASAGEEIPALVSVEVADEFGRAISASVESEKPMIVSRRVYQDGYWNARLLPDDQQLPPIDAEVFSVDFLSQGVLVPAGYGRIEFFYAPWWHWLTLTIAAAGWASVLFAFVARTRLVATGNTTP